jgi:hypothetical protein
MKKRSQTRALATDQHETRTDRDRLASRRGAQTANSEISDNQKGQEAKFQDQGRPALFRGPAGLRQHYYYTSANYESLQGVKDPSEPVAVTASPTVRTSV